MSTRNVETEEATPPSYSPRVSESHRNASRLPRFLEAYALLGMLLGAAAFFSLWPKTSDVFLTTANLQVLLSSQAVVAVIALGVLVPLICLEFDLSVGATAGLAAVITASAFSAGVPFPLAIAGAVAAGALIGLVSGTFVTRIGVDGVIVTLGVATLIEGVVQHRTGGLPLTGDVPIFLTEFGSGTFAGIPVLFWVLVAIAGGTHLLLEHTGLGRELFAVGSSRPAARLVGIRVERLLGLTFVLAGSLAGAAGVLYVVRAGGTDPQVGPGFLLPAFAAAFLSAASVKPGRYNVPGTLIAIYFLAVLNNGLALAGAAPYVTSYINGLALLAGISVAVLMYRRRQMPH